MLFNSDVENLKQRISVGKYLVRVSDRISVNIYDVLQVFTNKQTKNKLHGLSPRANHTDRATAACRRSDCQILRIEGATWSA
jgi:hypothetical protein